MQPSHHASHTDCQGCSPTDNQAVYNTNAAPQGSAQRKAGLEGIVLPVQSFKVNKSVVIESKKHCSGMSSKSAVPGHLPP